MIRRQPSSSIDPAGRSPRYARPALPLALAGTLSSCSAADVGRTVWPWPRLSALPVIALVALAVLSSCGSTTSRGASAPTTAEPTARPTTTAPATTAPVTTTVTTAASRPTAAFDGQVVVDDASIHLRCDGSGPTTVVLIPGFEADSTGWSSVMAEVAGAARVCTYDRPGTGLSRPGDEVMTFSTQAALLHDVLEAAGEPGPYVVVGHSFGGPEAIEFTRHHQDEVNGVVLVDASPTGWPDELCAVAADGTEAAAFIRSMCDSWRDPMGNVEHLDVFGAFDALDGTTPFGAIPLEVLTAVDRELPPDIAAAERARLTEVWDAGQQRWTQLSPASRLTSVDHTSHHIEIDRPEVVVAAIERLVP